MMIKLPGKRWRKDPRVLNLGQRWVRGSIREGAELVVYWRPTSEDYDKGVFEVNIFLKGCARYHAHIVASGRARAQGALGAKRLAEAEWKRLVGDAEFVIREFGGGR